MVRHLCCSLAHIEFARFPVIKRFFAETRKDQDEKTPFTCSCCVATQPCLEASCKKGQLFSKVRCLRYTKCFQWRTLNHMTIIAWPALWFSEPRCLACGGYQGKTAILQQMHVWKGKILMFSCNTVWQMWCCILLVDSQADSEPDV